MRIIRNKRNRMIIKIIFIDLHQIKKINKNKYLNNYFKFHIEMKNKNQN